MERDEVVEYIERNESDDEYDEVIKFLQCFPNLLTGILSFNSCTFQIFRNYKNLNQELERKVLSIQVLYFQFGRKKKKYRKVDAADKIKSQSPVIKATEEEEEDEDADISKYKLESEVCRHPLWPLHYFLGPLFNRFRNPIFLFFFSFSLIYYSLYDC